MRSLVGKAQSPSYCAERYLMAALILLVSAMDSPSGFSM